MIRRTEYSRARHKTSRRRARWQWGGSPPSLPSPLSSVFDQSRSCSHRTPLPSRYPCRFFRLLAHANAPAVGTGNPGARDKSARAEGKHGGEVANIWGSGGRATRALIELYESRVLSIPTVVVRSISPHALPLLAHPPSPASSPSPLPLPWPPDPLAHHARGPFAHSHSLFSSRKYLNEYQDRSRR